MRFLTVVTEKVLFSRLQKPWTDRAEVRETSFRGERHRRRTRRARTTSRACVSHERRASRRWLTSSRRSPRKPRGLTSGQRRGGGPARARVTRVGSPRATPPSWSAAASRAASRRATAAMTSEPRASGRAAGRPRRARPRPRGRPRERPRAPTTTTKTRGRAGQTSLETRRRHRRLPFPGSLPRRDARRCLRSRPRPPWRIEGT